MEIKELKSQLPKGRSILAFDYGEKRLGVAVSDLLLMTANPVKIIYRTCLDNDIKEIEQIIEEREVGAIVYGLPLQMDGSAGKTTEMVKEFAQKISQKIKLPYAFWDERLSSKAVENFFIK